MDDHPSLLPYEARQVIDQRLRAADSRSTVRAVRGSRSPAGRRRLAAQLRSVADRLDT